MVNYRHPSGTWTFPADSSPAASFPAHGGAYDEQPAAPGIPAQPGPHPGHGYDVHSPATASFASCGQFADDDPLFGALPGTGGFSGGYAPGTYDAYAAAPAALGYAPYEGFAPYDEAHRAGPYPAGTSQPPGAYGQFGLYETESHGQYEQYGRYEQWQPAGMGHPQEPSDANALWTDAGWPPVAGIPAQPGPERADHACDFGPLATDPWDHGTWDAYGYASAAPYDAAAPGPEAQPGTEYGPYGSGAGHPADPQMYEVRHQQHGHEGPFGQEPAFAAGTTAAFPAVDADAFHAGTDVDAAATRGFEADPYAPDDVEPEAFGAEDEERNADDGGRAAHGGGRARTGSARRGTGPGAGSRSRARPRPRRRSAVLTVAVPSVCVLGVASAAAASLMGGGDDTRTQAGQDDGRPVQPSSSRADDKVGERFAGASAAEEFAGRASRTQERLDLKKRQQAAKERKAKEAARKEAMRPKFALPVQEHGLSARFGQSGANWMSIHTGIDFPVSEGTPVRAATDGTITTKFNPSYGNMAIVTASDGTETRYCHLSSTKIRSGKVKAGETIAYSGSSGNSTGPHLHFEVRPGGGAAIDPLPWLQKKGLNPT